MVPEAEGHALAAKYGLTFVQTSAKTGHNVEDSFKQLATMIL